MIARSECLRRKSSTIKKVFFAQFYVYVVAFCRLDRRFGPTFGVRNSHFSGGRIFKNALRTFESANSRDWNSVSSIFRWSLLSGGRKDRFDCMYIHEILSSQSLRPCQRTCTQAGGVLTLHCLALLLPGCPESFLGPMFDRKEREREREREIECVHVGWGQRSGIRLNKHVGEEKSTDSIKNEKKFDQSPVLWTDTTQ